MKKKIIIGSILSFLILVLVPSIPAIQFNEIKESFQSNLFDSIQNGYNENFNDAIDSDKPIVMPQLFAIPYAILTFIILCIIFGIIGAFGTIIAFIINAIVGSVTGLVGVIWTILKLIVNVIVAIMSGTISTIGEIFGLFSVWISLIINAVSQQFSSMKEFMVLLIGLVIDILKLIYDTIFQNPMIY